jgi:hypothetical protein
MIILDLTSPMMLFAAIGTIYFGRRKMTRPTRADEDE